MTTDKDLAALDAEIVRRLSFITKGHLVDCQCDSCLFRAYQAATRAALQQLQIDAHQRITEIAKLTSEVLHERDKVEAMAQRADRFLDRAEAAEARLAQVEAALRAKRQAPDEEFYEWCDYDMEIEAAKVAFERAADMLRERPPA